MIGPRRGRAPEQADQQSHDMEHEHMKSTNVAVAATALSAALVLSACGGGRAPAGTTAPAAPPSASVEVSAAHGEADIAFAQGMIPHHEQAVTMSRLAADRAGAAEVRDLAAAIEQAQGPEIARLRGLLTAWGAPETGAMPGMDPGTMDHGNGDHGSGPTGSDHGGTAGMMTPEQMTRLERSSGAGFDREWLQMMIAHHEGAVEMATAELRDGTDPEARAMAQEIIDAQKAEITRMRQLLG